MPDSDREEFLRYLGPIQSHALRCIRCGFCNAACPTSKVESAFRDTRTSRGRVVLVQSLVENVEGIDPYDGYFKELIDLCYSCRRCVPVCPAGIPIPDLMSHTRHAYLEGRGRSALTLGHRIYAKYGTFDRFGSATAPISNWFLRRRFFRRILQLTTHIDSRAQLPRFERTSFEAWFKVQRGQPRSKKIVYFVDSYANYNNPSFAKTVTALLGKLGYEIILPPQKESGMPAIEFGLLEEARQVARYNLNQLAPYARNGLRIVCTSPAASYLLREGYGKILDDQEVTLVSQATVDIAELLLEEYEKGVFSFSKEIQREVQYHYCCLSKALSLAPVTTRLFEVGEIPYTQMEECCGGAGVWGTFKENYEMSSEIAAKLREKIEPGRIILTESETCRLQIELQCNARVRFPIEFLAPYVRT